MHILSVLVCHPCFCPRPHLSLCVQGRLGDELFMIETGSAVASLRGKVALFPHRFFLSISTCVHVCALV